MRQINCGYLPKNWRSIHLNYRASMRMHMYTLIQVTLHMRIHETPRDISGINNYRKLGQFWQNYLPKNCRSIHLNYRASMRMHMYTHIQVTLHMRIHETPREFS